MTNMLNYFNKIHDIRRNQGKKYKLSSISLLVILGYKSLAQIYSFGRHLKKDDKKKLCFKDKTPSHPTITETMKKIHPEELEVTLEQIVAKKASHFQHVAIDGKSIRSTNQSA
jgi:hypothetical protein